MKFEVYTLIYICHSQKKVMDDMTNFMGTALPYQIGNKLNGFRPGYCRPLKVVNLAVIHAEVITQGL